MTNTRDPNGEMRAPRVVKRAWVLSELEDESYDKFTTEQINQEWEMMVGDGQSKFLEAAEQSFWLTQREKFIAYENEYREHRRQVAKEKQRARCRANYRKNVEARRAYGRQYVKTHAERCAEHSKAHYERNKDAINRKRREARARRKLASTHMDDL